MEKKHLLIDCSFINDSRYWPVSIAIYAGRLLSGFNNSPIFRVSAIVWKGKENYVNELAGFDVEKIRVDKKSKVTPWRTLDRLMGFNPIINEIEQKEVDIILSPYHFECNFFFPKKYRHYAVVQDMIPYYILEQRLGKLKFWFWRIYRRILNSKITTFIAISKETQKEFLRLEGKKSVVIYNSIPIDLTFEEEPVIEIESKHYILDINRFEKHKNAGLLIKAFSMIYNKIPHILYLKGDERHAENRIELENLVLSLGLKDRVIFDKSNRSKGEIRYLYSHADLVVSPSLMEGFGWTPIEAAILEAPVLVSNTDVFKEITCDKITTFNPYSSEELANMIMKIISNPPHKEERKALSRFFIEQYSLDKQMRAFSNIFLSDIIK